MAKSGAVSGRSMVLAELYKDTTSLLSFYSELRCIGAWESYIKYLIAKISSGLYIQNCKQIFIPPRLKVTYFSFLAIFPIERRCSYHEDGSQGRGKVPPRSAGNY